MMPAHQWLSLLAFIALCLAMLAGIYRLFRLLPNKLPS